MSPLLLLSLLARAACLEFQHFPVREGRPEQAAPPRPAVPPLLRAAG